MMKVCVITSRLKTVYSVFHCRIIC